MIHVQWLKKSHLIVFGSSIGMLFLLLSLLFLRFPGFSPRVFALGAGIVVPSNPICATASAAQKGTLCNQQDPVSGGCAADAHTTASSVLIEGGKSVGVFERRHSALCGTYWGRIFDYRPEKRPLTIQVHIQGMAQDTFPDTELYSNMVFVPTPQDLVPQMDGMLGGDQGTSANPQNGAITATLPAIPSLNEP